MIVLTKLSHKHCRLTFFISGIRWPKLCYLHHNLQSLIHILCILDTTIRTMNTWLNQFYSLNIWMFPLGNVTMDICVGKCILILNVDCCAFWPANACVHMVENDQKHTTVDTGGIWMTDMSVIQVMVMCLYLRSWWKKREKWSRG